MEFLEEGLMLLLDELELSDEQILWCDISVLCIDDAYLG